MRRIPSGEVEESFFAFASVAIFWLEKKRAIKYDVIRFTGI